MPVKMDDYTIGAHARESLDFLCCQTAHWCTGRLFAVGVNE